MRTLYEFTMSGYEPDTADTYARQSAVDREVFEVACGGGSWPAWYVRREWALWDMPDEYHPGSNGITVMGYSVITEVSGMTPEVGMFYVRKATGDVYITQEVCVYSGSARERSVWYRMLNTHNGDIYETTEAELKESFYESGTDRYPDRPEAQTTETEEAGSSDLKGEP